MKKKFISGDRFALFFVLYMEGYINTHRKKYSKTALFFAYVKKKQYFCAFLAYDYAKDTEYSDYRTR